MEKKVSSTHGAGATRYTQREKKHWLKSHTTPMLIQSGL